MLKFRVKNAETLVILQSTMEKRLKTEESWLLSLITHKHCVERRQVENSWDHVLAELQKLTINYTINH